MEMSWLDTIQSQKDCMLSGNVSVSERECCIGGIGVTVIGRIIGKLCFQSVIVKKICEVLISRWVEDI